MKSIVLSGLDCGSEVYKRVKALICGELEERGSENHWLDLAEKDIRYCLGCDHCTFVKPGICTIQDDMQDIFPRMAGSEFHVFLSSVSFGGYNSALKKAIDRYSALGLPTYTFNHGEFHHPPRYPNPEKFLSVGILKEEDSRQEATFELVSERLAVSSFVSSWGSVILYQDQREEEICESIKKGFTEMGPVK